MITITKQNLGVEWALKEVEKSKRWRSINQLMSEYSLSFPFTLRHREWGEVYIIRLRPIKGGT